MEHARAKHGSSGQEVNLKSFLRKLVKHRYLFLISLGICWMIALLYGFLATPKYEVSTSILIDSSGNNRVLGDSKYVDGGVSLIEMEKNLYNEIGIIKSFSLMSQTVKDLGFNVSYHSGTLLGEKERYGYFPLHVVLADDKPQLYNEPFEIELLPNDQYRLSIDVNTFRVSNPANGSSHEVNRSLDFSKVFSFGETVTHEYFNFVVEKPGYEVNSIDFEGEDFSFVVHDVAAVANSYIEKLSVENIDIQASIFKIVSTGKLIDKEIDFLRKLMENYIGNNIRSRNKIASSKEDFIREQLRMVSDSLTKVEFDLEAYKKDKKALNLGATASNALNQTANLEVERSKIAMDIQYYRSLIRDIENHSKDDEFLAPTAIGVQDPLINSNLVELQGLYTRKSKLKSYVTSSNQEMQTLNSQIDESVATLLNNLRNAIKSSRFSLGGINTQLANFDGVISNLPSRENQLLTIQRQSTLYENLFNYLSQELAKTGIARAESTSDTRVLDEARMVGDGPVSPQKKLLLVLATLLGLIAPLLKIIFFSGPDAIESTAQIVANTDIPIIASVTHYDAKSPKAAADTALWKTKESFRDLYANLELIGKQGSCTVLGITSIMPEEGKTYCAINIGITLAEAGKKTLILDGDLRKPSLVADGFQKMEGKGLSNYLKGNLNAIEDILYSHDSLENLDFIPTAVFEGNIHGLLGGPKMESLMLQLKQKYDYIIIDTPAVGLVSDFLLLSNFVDINLFVARRTIAKVDFLNDFEKLKNTTKGGKSFIIFNGTLDKDYKYGYGQKYGLNEEQLLVSESLAV